MRPELRNLFLCLMLAAAGFVFSAYASTTNAVVPQKDNPQVVTQSNPLSLDDLTDREAWNLARKSFKKAKAAEKKKQTDAASVEYELTLKLLGSLDADSTGSSVKDVLEFQREVLNKYDHFLASIETLPATASPTAVIEAGAGNIKEITGEDEPANPADRDARPIIIAGKESLPRIPWEKNNLVQAQINFFQGKGRKVMLRWMERSAEVFPRLRPILQEEGMPEDLLFLSMIESGLNTEAYSYAHASGLWQFIPGTGRIYGLNVDRVYDERRHVEEATRAACRYLRTLYDEFQDWYLTMAAYNCGEGRIRYEIIRGRTHDYWSMKRLPRQTKSYVPIFLAAREIYRDPERYGFPPIPKEVPFECYTASVPGGYSLENVAMSVGADPEVVRDLNPEYLKGILPKTDSPCSVRLPVKPKENFLNTLSTLPRTEIAPTLTYVVRRGESLESIARRYGVSVSDIKAQPENRRVLAGRLNAGSPLVIPVPGAVRLAKAETKQEVKLQVAESKSAAKVKPDSPSESTKQPQSEVQKASLASADTLKTVTRTDQIVYTVHGGESLGKISRQLGVSVDQIVQENNIKDTETIQPGQKLKITVVSTGLTVAQKQDETLKTKYYVVRNGDTLWSIAQRHGQSVDKVYEWNGLSSDSTIHPGQKLVIGLR